MASKNSTRRLTPVCTEPSSEESERDLRQAHTILMEVLSHSTLLVAALERLEQDEPALGDCVHGGGAEFAAKAIKFRVREAQSFLDYIDLGDEVMAIHHELFDVWSLAALAEHALASDAPLHGWADDEKIFCNYPAVAAVRSVQKATDQLTDRLDLLMGEMSRAKKRAA